MAQVDLTGLSKLRDRIDELSQTKTVPITDLLPDAFMAKNTKFGNFQSMMNAAGVKEESGFQGDAWNKFVSKQTSFESWQHMINKAGGEYAAKKLFDGV